MATLAEHSTATISSAADLAATGGRLLLAAIFLLSGWSKIADAAGTIGYIQSVGLPFAELGVALAIAVELIGGLLLVVGYRTKLAATALGALHSHRSSVLHSDLGDQNQFIHFFKNEAIVGGLLQVIAFGAGRLSIDGRSRV